MAHQMKNIIGFSVFHCVEGAFGASSVGTPKMQNGVPRDELKNGRGRGWAVPYFFSPSRCGSSGDSRPAILGIVRFATRDSVPLRLSARHVLHPHLPFSKKEGLTYNLGHGPSKRAQ